MNLVMSLLLVEYKTVKSRKAEAYLEAFRTLFDEVSDRGFKPELVQLDNEALKLLCNYITAQNIDIQLVTPGNHCKDQAQ